MSNCITCINAKWDSKATKEKNTFGGCPHQEEFYRHGLGRVVRVSRDDRKIENCQHYKRRK